MEKALANNEFKLWLQPKYDIRTHKVISAEALVRWDSPDMGFYTPAEFIDLFERNGFIMQLDYFILSQAFELQKKRRDKGLPIIPISVNQSGLHMNENGYIKNMMEIVKKYGSPRDAIVLEITETAFVDYATKSARNKSLSIVQKLKDMDFEISMDDFCTGYSSIAMLETFPIDEIKIDRAMLLSAEKSLKARKILQTMINLGKDLKVRVVTEGIETVEQEQMLLGMGCFTGQGYLFSKPLPRDRFSDFVNDNLNVKSED
ncbi:MAG: EAL domain-containing protein [Butyrivibrio sp.]|nr:EAL domain-containing protein [Butyrivibrio sp.]